jgi:putative RecB family exonuclease
MIRLAVPVEAKTSSTKVQRDYLSYSAVRTFQSCPLKYKFRYVEQLPEAIVSASLVFGSALHAAVEHQMRSQLEGADQPDVSQLLQVYREQVQAAQIQQPILFPKGEDAASLEAQAARMLQSFLASDLAQPVGRILGVEEQVRGDLSPQLPEIMGYADLIFETEEAVTVRDFKTAKAKWSQEQANEQADQLLLYGHLIRELVPGKPIQLQFAILTKHKTPQTQVLDMQPSPRRLQRTRRIFVKVWHAIQSQHYYPVPSPVNCSGCGYRRQCAAWEG